MKKRQYSLTAKERKQKRNSAQEKQSVYSASAQSAEQAMIASQKKQRVSSVIIIAAVVLVILLLLSAVLIPITVYMLNPFYDAATKNPIARISLNNGMVLDFEIFEEDCPIASTNFIFLAREGYFNNTIIFDSQNNWVRFGGYENEGRHRSEDTDYMKKFTAIRGYENNKFSYRLKADTNAIFKTFDQMGVLCFLYNNTSTEFQISAALNSPNHVVNSYGGTTTYTPGVFGRYYDEKTLQNVQEIAAMNRATAFVGNRPWKRPLPDVRIRSVKVYNLDKSKWNKDFDFVGYLNETNALSYWSG